MTDVLTEPGGNNPTQPRSRPLEPGQAVGRYVLVRQLGRGGMGVVYQATDPSLERSIAIKFILRQRAGALATQRLRREAVAMAQVSHPNVITVVDVGEHEGDVFVAMEMLDGITLRTWLHAQARDSEDIHRVFHAAGSGLLALHQAGLVHRDFKPDNVMITGDRVVVMDLGLAAIDSDGPASYPEDLAITASTHVGGFVGTPAYMSPEQFAGRSLDARSDQFSFAVALYEALVGHRPWPSERLPELVAALETQPPRRIPSEAEVPRATRRALTRALRYDLDERFENMTDLLRALDGRPARSWTVAPSPSLTSSPTKPTRATRPSAISSMRASRNGTASSRPRSRSSSVATTHCEAPDVMRRRSTRR